MSHTPDAVHAATENNSEMLLEKANVIGVGEGDGEVIVFVTQKQPLSALSVGDVVDPELDDGVPTDVVEVGEFKALGEVEKNNHTSGLRPGASIGRLNAGGTGTLGCLVMKGGELHLLSNNHVIAGNNSTPIGYKITHPGPGDASSSNRKVIGTLAAFVRIDFGGNNRLDAAIAKVTDFSSVVGNDAIVSPLAPIPAVGTSVIKTGRTTATSTGKVVALNATISVSYGNSGTARFTGQIVTEDMLSPGDSGSVGRLPDGRPFGLGFAGSSTRSIFNPIKEVFDYFSLTLPDETPPPPPPPDEGIKEFLTDLRNQIDEKLKTL